MKTLRLFRKVLETVLARFSSPQHRSTYYELPGTRQWSPGAIERVDKTKWKRCEACERSIPVDHDGLTGADGFLVDAGTWTYICPFCSHCHVGTPVWNQDTKRQQTCHECGTELAEHYQCPQCSFPRGWMRVNCPYCGNRQPVCAPHWVAHCDLFSLECVRCEKVFYSLCIC